MEALEWGPVIITTSTIAPINDGVKLRQACVHKDS